MPSPLLVAIRHYAGHRVTRTVAGIGLAGIIAVGTVGLPAFTDARTAAQEQLSTLDVQITGQLDAAERADARLVAQIEEAQKLVEQAGEKGALPEKGALASLKTQIAEAEKALATLDKLAGAAEAKQAEADADALFLRTLTDEHDDLADAFQALRAQTVTVSKIDLAPAVNKVRAEIEAKANAEAQAAAEQAAAEQAAAEAQAAEEAAAEQAQHAATHEGGGAGYSQQQPSSQPATGGGDCRAQAAGLVASLSGAPTVWADLGYYGLTGGGVVMLGGGPTVTLSSGTDPSFWCLSNGSYVAAHEAAHALHDARLDALLDAGYSWDWQLANAENAADCIAHGWGYTAGSTYGCTAEGQHLASLILG